MPRGGSRPGAGRRKESKNKLSVQAVEAAAATGMLPHEILLSVARGNPLMVPVEVKGKVTLKAHHPSAEQMIDAAKGAAPYYAPRLSAVGIKAAGPDNPWPELLKMVDGSGRKPPSEAAGSG